MATTLTTNEQTALPTTPQSHDARAVANYFLERAAQEGKVTNHLQLQKLVYIAHGWHLAITDKPLIFQNVFAWPYGPVIPQVYNEFKEYGRDPIDGRAAFLNPVSEEWEPYAAHFGAESLALLDRVWDAYKSYSGIELSAITHDKGTPWDRVAGHLNPKQIRDKMIPNSLIREHYLKLVQSLREMRAKNPI